MHFDFRQKSNKISSDANKTWNEAEVDNALNNATTELVEILYSGQNLKKYKLGFEVTQQRIDMLQPLVMMQVIPGTDFIRGNLAGTEYPLPQDYLHFIRAYGPQENCANLTAKVAIEQSQDMTTVLFDTHRGPSSKWGRFPGHIIGDMLTCYHLGRFNVPEIQFEYIRQPAKVNIGSYPDIDGNPAGPAVSSDLPEFLHSTVVSVAVQEFARSLAYMDQLNMREHAINNTIQ